MVVATILAGGTAVSDDINITVGSANALEQSVLDVGGVGGHVGIVKSLGDLRVVVAWVQSASRSPRSEGAGCLGQRTLSEEDVTAVLETSLAVVGHRRGGEGGSSSKGNGGELHFEGLEVGCYEIETDCL